MRNAVFLAVPLAVAGCNSTPQNPVDASIVQAVVNQPITCQAGPDCETKWSRATAWIAQNAAYKVQTASDSIIQTMGPLPNDPRPSFTVTKAGDSTGTYTVSFNGGCDNFLGCIPTIAESKLSFVSFINAGAPPPVLAHQGKPLGFKSIAVPQGAAASLKLDSDRGMIIAEVTPDSPSAKAGLVKGDVMLTMDGRPINNQTDMAAAINAAAPRHKLEIGISRAGDARSLTVAF
jgi:membrane-associated protease RseP (regulator of RpoE activity)